MLGLVLVLGPTRAHGFAIGFTGRSGREGLICTQCHVGGTEPLVHFEGPQTLAAGAIATFRFVIQSQSPSQTFAGLDVAPGAGTLAAVSGQDEQILGDELTHTMPKQNDSGGVASYEFTWTAPTTVGMQTLFGAGNSVNHNGLDTGDNAAAATYVINVLATPMCSGDCSGDGDVTIEDLVLAVDVATGHSAIDMCVAANLNGDAQVDVSELLTAIHTALVGCSAQP